MKVVMVVDDDSRILRLLKCQLEQDLECKVYGVADPRHAVKMALILSPDLIVLDVSMPGQDGGEVARQIQAQPTLSRVPLVYYSSLVTEKEAEQMKRQGCKQQYVSKTDTPWGLMPVIRKVFGEKDPVVAANAMAAPQPA